MIKHFDLNENNGINFADIHIHALFGADDGAKNEEIMSKMISAEYDDGVRFICLTPHYHPGYFGDNHDAVMKAYEKLCRECESRFPQLTLALGNELRYDDGCVSWLRNGSCLTMNETDYVLVDFFETQASEYIHQSLERILNSGYTPILAHAERYEKLTSKDIIEFRENGILIQLDTQSLSRAFGFSAQRRCKAYIKARLADFVGSDSHNLTSRPPGISEFYQAAIKLSDEEYAVELCCKNAEEIIFCKNL